MTIGKDHISASIEAAKANLQQALADLDHLPTFDAEAFGFALHALHNYLAVTGGLASLLSDALDDHPDAEVHTWLEALQHATDLMTQTLRQMGKDGDGGEVTLVREKVDAPKAVQRVCTYYQKLAERKGIRVIFESAVESPAYLWTNRVAAGAVLDNLLSNAIKYSQPRQRVWVRITAEPSHLVCSVRDEGPGLSSEDQAKLFQRGVRLGPAPTGGESSTGFGLAVAKELIDKLDGTLWCESREGHGASFKFRLPMYVKEAHAEGNGTVGHAAR